MPKTTEEIVAIVKLANKYKIPYLPRGNGTFFGVALQTLLAEACTIEQGIIIDLWRMKDIHVDPEIDSLRPSDQESPLLSCKKQRTLISYVRMSQKLNPVSVRTPRTSVSSPPGAIPMDGEPITSSTRNSSTQQGQYMHLSDKDIPNPYASEQGLLSLSLIPSVIVTQLTLKLHQILDDEEAIFIPFTNLSDALDLAHESGKKKYRYFSSSPLTEISHGVYFSHA